MGVIVCPNCAVRPETIRELADHPRLRTAETLEDALAIIRREAAAEDAVFISGSLFLVGEARQRLVARGLWPVDPIG